MKLLWFYACVIRFSPGEGDTEFVYLGSRTMQYPEIAESIVGLQGESDMWITIQICFAEKLHILCMDGIF